MSDAETPSIEDAELAEESEEEVLEEELPQPELLHGVPVSESRGQVVLHPSREEYVALVSSLRELGYWMCIPLST